MAQSAGGSTSNHLGIAAAGLWLALVLCGSKLLYEYKGAAGAFVESPALWPSSSRLARNPSGPTLLMMVHPRCPCTQASVSELARLLTRVGAAVRAYALILRPRGASEEWTRSESRRRLEQIPNLTVLTDYDALETDRFHAVTSGQTLLYDARGALRFSGGITPARGHEGDSVGRQELTDLIERGRSAHRSSPVLGCALRGPTDQGASQQ